MSASRLIRTCIISCVLLFVSACATIGYDQQTDQQISTLAQDINFQLLNWEHEAADGKHPATFDSKFYDKAESGLAVLSTRLELQDPINKARLTSIVQGISDELSRARDIHKKQDQLTPEFLHALRGQLNAQLGSLTQYELSLKSGSTAQAASSPAAGQTGSKK